MTTTKFDMYPKGSPKYNIGQLSTKGKTKSSPKHTKRPSAKIRKRTSPKGAKQRAQWNVMLEKSLVEILHEHDNPYHRGQNGWSGHTAEGNFNFTSTAEQSQKPDVESDDDQREMDKQAALDEEDLQILDQSKVEQVQVNQRNAEMDIEQVNQRNAEMEQVQVNHRKAPVVGPLANKPNKPKRSPKKSSGDGLVGVMERFVNIKEKETNQEATQDFSITKCIAALRTLEEFDPAEKARAFAVFKSVENREIFLGAVDEKDGSAMIWLRSEMDNMRQS